jgi:hypothetical protein
MKTGYSPSLLSTYITNTCKAMLGFVGVCWVIFGSDGFTLVTVISFTPPA